jgi:hypothetical protein
LPGIVDRFAVGIYSLVLFVSAIAVENIDTWKAVLIYFIPVIVGFAPGCLPDCGGNYPGNYLDHAVIRCQPDTAAKRNIPGLETEIMRDGG